MKRKRNSVAVLGLMALLGIGFFIPTVMMQLEDLSILGEKKSVEIEEIQLNSKEVDVLEELEDFPEMLANNIIVEIGDGVKAEYADLMQDAEVQAVAEGKEESVSYKLYDTTQDFLTMLDVKAEIVLEKFSAINYVMMVEENVERVYSIWYCTGYDKAENPYYFWIDEAVGMVMAFDVPYEVIGDSEEAFYSAMNRLVQYYDFENYGYPIYSFSENKALISEKKYWSTDLLILNKEGEEKISLCVYKVGNRISFNTLPGNASISYDAQ